MERHIDDIISERALDSSPSSNRPGKGPLHPALATTGKPPSNPTPAYPTSSVPVRFPTPVQLEESKFDQLATDEGDFTDKLIEEDFPEDWGDDKHEFVDENGWNLLHYSVIKGFSNAVTVLVEDLEFDVNKKTHDGRTPLELVLQKCCDCLDKGASNEIYHGIAITLMKSDATVDGVEENVLRLAVNFPVILKNILERHPQYYNSLRKAVKHLHKSYSRTGFIELVLQQGVDIIVMDLIDMESTTMFLKTYTNDDGETPLHTVAKLGKVEIVKRLMECKIGESMCKPDRNHYTPIVSALVSHEYKRIMKEQSVKVVFEILSYLSTLCTDCTKCIEAIKDAKYRGLPVIEYDIKSGQGIIIQAIMKLDDDICDNILRSESFELENVKELSIVHLAGRYGFSLQKVTGHKFKLEYLEGSDDTDEVEAIPKLWPCDYAVQYDQDDFLHDAWEFGREDWSHEIETACRFGNLKAFTYLISKTADAPTEDRFRDLLRLACQEGQASVVDYFLKTIKLSPERRPSEESQKLPSALMLAADSDAADCVTLLLDHNASVRDVDEKGYNALCRAILNGKKKAVMAILTHPVYGSEALRFCTKKTDKTRANITPMRLLVKHMTDVAKWVLNKQIIRKPSGEIIYNYELIDDFDSHVCTFGGPLGYLHRSLVEYGVLNPVDTRSNGKSSSSGGSTSVYKPQEYEAYNHMLYVMVKSKDLDILDHLLVGRVINHYWRYVIWQWMALRFVYLFITVWLTAFTLVLPHPNGDICKGRDGGISGGRRGFLIFSSILLILLSLLSLVVNGYTLYVARLTIFRQTRFRVFFESILPVLILMFVIGYGNDEWCPQRWQWNIGAFCTCLSWLSLLVTLKGFRWTAAPINMLFAIIKNFLQIIYVPILLIAAFALPFFMLFTRPGLNYGAYQDIGSTFGALAILFTGESDYQELFNEEDSVVNFPFASYFIYFFFVVMVGILFNNLLISLAVGEVGDLRVHAKLEQHRLNVEGIIDGLEIFFPFIPVKNNDIFTRKANIEDNEHYLKAESAWKEAVEESDQFADSILKATPNEVVQSKIDHLEDTFKERFEKLERSIQQLANKDNN